MVQTVPHGTIWRNLITKFRRNIIILEEIDVMIEFNNILTIKNLIIYLIIVNIIAFLAMFIDKKKAEKNRWRIKESTLLILALIGGSIGAIAGMYVFHHKTQKPRFYIGIPIIIVLQILLIIGIKSIIL